jgi:transcriptional regulator CtsR
MKRNVWLMIFGFLILSMSARHFEASAQTCSSTPATAGYRDFNYGSTVYFQPTAEKPEHKLWWNDGSWWGVLWSTSSNRYRIHQFNLASQCWTNVGPDVDDRSQTLSDALWDGTKLYIASHVMETTSATGNGRLYRYSYDAGADTYTLDAGFPVDVNGEKSETLTIAKDTMGKLWVTWASNTAIMVNRSTTDDLTWGTPFQIPVQGANVNGDDISAIVAFGNRIGVLWSNQVDEAMYFASHIDGDPDLTWQARETSLSVSNKPVADDHINIKMTSDNGGNVYVATKSSSEVSSETLIYVLKRDGSSGVWSAYEVSKVSDDHTRPILAVDTENRNLYVFMARLTGTPRSIYMKSSNLDNISFPLGVGAEFIRSESDALTNNPTSMRQNVNSTTGILVLASDEGTRNYLHNYLSLAPATPPAAPSGLTATTISASQINLAWTDNSNNETGFKIERKTGAAGTYAEVGSVGAGVTSFSNTGLAASTEYFYRVFAHNGSGNSSYSNEANATTQSPPAPPSAPSGLTATAISSSQINLTWTDNSNNEDGFKIERKTGAAGTYAEVGSVGAGVTSFSNTGLAASTQYFYRVFAHNAGGNSAYSNEANATTSGTVAIPAAPTNLVATAVSSSQINLTWTDASNNEDGFKIERRNSGTTVYVEIAIVGANVTAYANTGLAASTKYGYRVRSYNSAGNSAYSNLTSATTLAGTTPPSAPSNLVATAISSSQINLTWTDNASNEDGFKIERKTGAAGTYAEVGSVGANVTSFSNTGLAASTQYFYRVLAHNAGGNSAYSNEANATTQSPPTPPNAPSGLTATTISSSQINLTWTDNASNEDGFKIERKTGAAGTYAEVGSVGANVTSFSSTGLAASTQYFYRVLAHNAGGNSAYSNEANATTSAASGNLALNKPATAFSTSGTNVASRAVDGSASTFWRSGSLTSNPVNWLRVDLQTVQTVSRVVVNWRSSFYATNYQIQVSTDDVNWTSVLTDNAGNGGIDNVSFAAVSARYVRVHMTTANSTSYRINEFEVYSGLAKEVAANRGAEAAAPREFTLAQNYPNPFNPSTSITFGLPQAAHVTLKVYNVIGAEAAKLVEGTLEAGSHTVTFNAQALPSGIYYYVLARGETKLVRKLLLVK